jgi:hypothetical protein
LNCGTCATSWRAACTGVRAHHLLAAGREVERGEKAVTHEFQDLAPIVEHRPRHDFEVGIEQLDERALRNATGHPGESAQVAKPDDGLDVLHRVAVDFPRQHASAGIGPEIGFEERLARRRTSSAT